ncbi:MAG: helix-turn-helix transcriptional regulator [DPANN group archaeon]|nr:helix-turn-helix transcriptional regulator [DPANN group archaeon]
MKDTNATAFLKVMGNTPINKVLDFLVVYDQFDYSITDIAKNSKVGYATLMRIWNSLEKNGIVLMSRVVGRAKMYKLNKANLAVQHFIKMYWEITNKATERLEDKVPLFA